MTQQQLKNKFLLEMADWWDYSLEDQGSTDDGDELERLNEEAIDRFIEIFHRIDWC